MISRHDAVERASAYLRERGSSWVAFAEGARPNPTQDLWVVEHRDPQHQPGEMISGGSVLVVPSSGPVREVSYHPSAQELIGLQDPAEVAGLPSDWSEVLADYLDGFDWWSLIDWLDSERTECDVYPSAEGVFGAFRLTPYDQTRVVILGQDPYPRPGQAHGLSFSVPRNIPKPRSLINIHRLLRAENITPSDHGNLEGWARQGVLMLNTALTVRHGKPGSHASKWKTVTDAAIQAVSEKDEPVVFILWGAHARSRKRLIDVSRHRVIESAHPTSRANAKDPFMRSQPFSETNQVLKAPIKWGDAEH